MYMCSKLCYSDVTLDQRLVIEGVLSRYICLLTSQSRTRHDLHVARMALALDCIRMKHSLPKRDFGLLSVGYVMMPSHLAKKEKALHASASLVPCDSIARGTQVQPTFSSCFLISAALAATPAATPTSTAVTISLCKKLVIR